MTAKSYPGLRPISDNSFRVFLVNLPQTRHPERSAAQIDRVTQRLWRGVEGPRRCLSYPCCSELFNHRARHGFFSGAENQKLLASRYVRRLHLHSRQPYRHALHWRSPANCISVSYNIKKVRGKVSVRPMAASACSILNATKIFAAIAREKQLKGWRRVKKLNLIGTINPEFKDLAQTWGWKMITVHERMYP
jgi:hypothetical protein